MHVSGQLFCMGTDTTRTQGYNDTKRLLQNTIMIYNKYIITIIF